MPSPDFQHFLNVATELARKASEEILKVLKNPTIHARKADSSIVTEADLASEKIILGGLQKAFPDHGILSEEAGVLGNAASDFCWMVDPLDGTKAYAKGIPGFCVMVGLLKEGKPHLGVIVDPLEGHVYQALHGEGAFHLLNGQKQRLHVSNRNEFKDMPLAISTGFPEKPLAEIRALLPGPLLPPINSVGIKVGLLVRQVGDIYLNHHAVSYWDTCAPQVLLEEAGGMMTKWDGTALTYTPQAPFTHDGPTIASNGTQHSSVVKKLSGLPLP